MLIHEPSRSILLTAPDPFLVRDLLPKSRLINYKDFDFNVAIKHTLESTKVLNNIGIHVPAPILSQYDWPGKYKPMAHQKVMAEFMTLNSRCFNLSEMGAAKTASALWAADWMMRQGYVKKVVVLAPLSTLERVWASDIFDVLMHRVAVVVHGSRERREKLLATDADFYIVNHEGISIAEISKTIRTRPDINLIIVDEGSKFRNAATQKYKDLARIIRQDTKLWWLTGTPCPNAPTDAWAQAKLVSPSRVPKFFGAFKRLTMVQVTPFKWVPRPDAYAVAHDAMQPAIRFMKKDCIDLPPVVTEDRQCELTSEQRAALKTMQASMRMESEHVKIDAANAADKINKIRQILCGCIKVTKTDEYITLPHNPRKKVLLDAIEDANAKVLVIVPHKGIIRVLEKELSDAYSVAVLNGDVPSKQRNKIILDFKTCVDPHILLCHPTVMAHGLNLTEADTLIFYGPIYSNDEYQQVIERFNRAGQTRKMTIIRIAAHPVEWEIYKMVDTKRQTQDSILNLYRLALT